MPAVAKLPQRVQHIEGHDAQKREQELAKIFGPVHGRRDEAVKKDDLEPVLDHRLAGITPRARDPGEEYRGAKEDDANIEPRRLQALAGRDEPERGGGEDVDAL